MTETLVDLVAFLRPTSPEPLERTSEWDAGERPETFPSGL